MTLAFGDSFDVAVTFASDWQIGDGSGRRASVDSTYVKDARGLPYVPASSVTGVLRDAVRTIVSGLDAGDKDGVWHQWARVLVGDEPGRSKRPPATGPLPSCLESAPLLMRGSLVGLSLNPPAPLTSDDIRGAIGVVRPSLKLDEDGVAAPDHLRFDERACGGVELSARWRFFGHTGDVPWQLRFLLVGASSLMTDYGSDRRRGCGQARTTLSIDDGFEHLLERAHHHVEAPGSHLTAHRVRVPRTEKVPLETDLNQTPSTRPPPWRRIAEIDVRLRGPVIVSESASCISARLLLPVLSDVLPALPALLTTGQIAVTDATPVIMDRRAQAWPGHWGRQENSVTSLLIHAPPTTKTRPDLDAWLIDDHVTKVVRARYTHNTIDPVTQRTAAAGLFQHVALAPGQHFRAEVWGSPAITHAIYEPLRGLGALRRRIGASRKDSYGDVEIICTAIEADSDAIAPPPAAAESRVLVCDSNVLVRSTDGRFDPSLSTLLTALGNQLGVRVELASDIGADVGAPASVISIEHDRSWHSGWGLPRQSLAAVRRGSYAVVEFTEAPSPERWALLCTRGLGSRLGEGFGRLRWYATDGPTPDRLVERDARTIAGVQAPEIAAARNPTSETILLRAWQTLVERRVVERAADLLDDGWLGNTENLTASQCGLIRAAALAGAERLPRGSAPPILAGSIGELRSALGVVEEWPTAVDLFARATLAAALAKAFAVRSSNPSEERR